MSTSRMDRREFLREGSVLVAAAAAGGAIGSTGGSVRGAEAPGDGAAGAKKILNHNPKMGYRRLGKTGLMISEISLGGHGAQGEDDAARVKNRAAVLRRAADLGLNYVDNNIVDECKLYGKAMRGMREKWIIGFASWPQKLTQEYESQLSGDRFLREIEGRLKDYHTDTLDIWRPVGATWGKGQTQMPTMLMVSRKVLDMVVETFEKARKQGKVRWLGISAHNPKVFRRVLNDYPQFSIIIFPYLFLTKEFGGDSLLKLAREKDVGVIGLKPFGAGTTFGLKPRQISGRVDKRAHVLLKEMLAEKRLSAVIPGVNVAEQLEENVRGSYERHVPRTPQDEQAFLKCRRNYYTHRTPEYRWLRHWEVV